MIGIKLRPGHHLVNVEPDDHGIIEVIGETRVDAETREDADLWFVAHLRSLNPTLTDDQFRASLRVSGPPWADYADLPWTDPDEPRHAVTLHEAETLIAEGWADPVAPDPRALDSALARWTR